MKKPQISVIMPVYNSEKYLYEAIESILNQTFKDFELIIINDCSIDNSLKIIYKYMKKDKRIKLINNKHNLGGPKSRNKALKIARGDYLASLDSDDIALPQRFNKQYDYLQKNKEIFLVGSNAFNIDYKGNIITKTDNLTGSSRLEKVMPIYNHIYHSSIMFRNEKKHFYRVKFRYAQDYDFYLCLLSQNKKLDNLRDVLIKYRINPSGVTKTNNLKQRLFAEKAQLFYQQRTKYGSDDYNSFDPNEILKPDLKKTKNKLIIINEIKMGLKSNDFEYAKKFCKRYFKYYGFFNIVLIFFIISHTNIDFVDFLRRLKSFF